MFYKNRKNKRYLRKHRKDICNFVKHDDNNNYMYFYNLVLFKLKAMYNYFTDQIVDYAEATDEQLECLRSLNIVIHRLEQSINNDTQLIYAFGLIGKYMKLWSDVNDSNRTN